ncbi:MAG: PaaI family thioesterase [Rhodospirillaceae bacterium]|jgi:acyl-coenzyme A thioesterase PaaI-like protein|nr:PaaI family thioesterase [Rhodospirillaceae bacterium]MBT4690051.1 PaaI family thioesterase [Rhodospirillaceae bacterium]MBT5080080.1 PaaI family thioesterase [Rhodospirillaceae bacterium]MBT5523540.1 PaaI family thioesterase [Rhodospirillaceae bacterium]MBT5878584.1 PaaI family thioesterase [Rhodospirillaceae bacterium]
MENETAAALEANPPTGFIHSGHRGPYTTHNGPYFHKIVDDQFWHGLRVMDRHCNAHGSLHGGMMTSFADGLLATAVWHHAKLRGVTVRMVCDLVGAVAAGAWLEGTARITGQDDDIAFTAAEAYADGKLVFTATGVFRTYVRPGAHLKKMRSDS